MKLKTILSIALIWIVSIQMYATISGNSQIYQNQNYTYGLPDLIFDQSYVGPTNWTCVGVTIVSSSNFSVEIKYPENTSPPCTIKLQASYLYFDGQSNVTRTESKWITILPTIVGSNFVSTGASADYVLPDACSMFSFPATYTWSATNGTVTYHYGNFANIQWSSSTSVYTGKARCVVTYGLGSSYSIELDVKINNGVPPSIPNGLYADNITGNSFTLHWNASSDAGHGVRGYRVYKNNVYLSPEVTTTSKVISGLQQCSLSDMKVYAIDNYGNESDFSSELEVRNSANVNYLELPPTTNPALANTQVKLKPGFSYSASGSNSFRAAHCNCGSKKSDIIKIENESISENINYSEVFEKDLDQLDLFSNSYTLYPNPASNNLFILKNEKNTDLSNIKIYAVDGTEVYSNVFTDEINIDISEFQRGLYLIRLINQKEDLYKKVIFE